MISVVQRGRLQSPALTLVPLLGDSLREQPLQGIRSDPIKATHHPTGSHIAPPAHQQPSVEPAVLASCPAHVSSSPLLAPVKSMAGFGPPISSRRAGGLACSGGLMVRSMGVPGVERRWGAMQGLETVKAGQAAGTWWLLAIG